MGGGGEVEGEGYYQLLKPSARPQEVCFSLIAPWETQLTDRCYITVQNTITTYNCFPGLPAQFLFKEKYYEEQEG